MASTAGLAPEIYSFDLEKRTIVMEYIQGTKVLNFLKEHPEEYVNLISDIIPKILHLNLSLNIYHHDIHAENIILTNDKILFFRFWRCLCFTEKRYLS
jgi:tRNA A-37 threonylcarbamoyl transferase component Bud32